MCLRTIACAHTFERKLSTPSTREVTPRLTRRQGRVRCPDSWRLPLHLLQQLPRACRCSLTEARCRGGGLTLPFARPHWVMKSDGPQNNEPKGELGHRTAPLCARLKHASVSSGLGRTGRRRSGREACRVSRPRVEV